MRRVATIPNRRRLLLGCALLSLFSWPLAAQAPPAPPPGDPDTGVVKDGYEVHQSFEFGGHITGFSGNGSMWNTFVNQQSGPRLLGQSLDLHSLEHSNLLFDELHETSYGYGGDPNNWTRLRVSKARVYDFSAVFRRHRNYWDFDLLANPLNPPTSNPNRPVLTSPHRFEVVRRMTDLNLTLAPLSPVRVRLSYSRNVSEGPSFSSDHQGTEALLLQRWRNGLDTYRAGVDLRVIPRTVFSYDQFVSVYKGDTFGELNSLPFNLAGSIPVDLGLPFNTAVGEPCATPILGTGFANPACNGFFAYSNFHPLRNLYPTEQFSFQSNYWRKLNLTGRVSYTGADSDAAVSSELFDGLIAGSSVRQSLTSGPVSTRRISVSADFTLAWDVTRKLKFVDTYRWSDFRSPGRWVENQSVLFGATLLTTPNVFTPATCPPPFIAATCPQHTAGSGPDRTVADFNHSLSQNLHFNTAQLEYRFTKRYRANLGYRFRQRQIDLSQFDRYQLTFFPTLPNRGVCAGQPLNPDGTCTVLTFNGSSPGNVVPSFTGLAPDANHIPIHEHSLLFGFMLLPWDQLRVTYDMELMYADRVFTRISPRHLQQYRLQLAYKPADWASLNASLNLRENRNNTLAIGNREHNRTYALSAVFTPRRQFTFDARWSYSDIFSATNICFVANPPPPGTSSCGGPFLADVSVYDQKVHFLAAGVQWKPVKRVTTELGYTGTFANGNTLLLNPLAPLGPLSYNYHLPAAAVRVELAPRWTLRGDWNYYGYNEKGDSGPTLPRDFRGNVFTTGLKYAF
jgi:hypothetical protein